MISKPPKQSHLALNRLIMNGLAPITDTVANE